MADPLKLRIVDGPRRGETFELKPGEPLVVGRSRDVAVSVDVAGLSRRHFEVLFDGTACRLRDLESRNGVAVNGRPVRDVELREGDTIEAAGTAYTIERGAVRRRLSESSDLPPLDGASAPARSPGAATEPTLILPQAVYESVAPTMSDVPAVIPPASLAAALVRAVPAPGTRLFAIVDGAQAFELAFTARLMGNRIYTLFSGARAVDLAHVGPCLIELAKPAPFLEKWVAALGRSAGVLFETGQELSGVYAHLRGIFLVADEREQDFFFRFYDPRVLRTFLPSCTPAEAAAFFGPVRRWIAERADADGYTLFALDGGRPVESHILAPAAPAGEAAP